MVRALVAPALAASLFACGSNPSESGGDDASDDVASADGGGDGGEDVTADVGVPDGSAPDVGVDVGDDPDGAIDVDPDIGVDVDTGDDPDVGEDIDVSVDTEAGVDTDVGVDVEIDVPDGWTTYEGTGWYQVGFESSQFIPMDDAELLETDAICPTLLLRDGADRIWAEGELEQPLSFAPFGGMGVGIYDVSGALSPPGEYGHLGWYQRQLDVAASTLHVCETVTTYGRECVVARNEGDFCFSPPPLEELSDIRLQHILAGPIGDRNYYSLAITADAHIADGMSVLHIDFNVPARAADATQEWDFYDDQVEWSGYLEIFGFAYQRIDIDPDFLSGWAFRHEGNDRVRISVGGASDSGQPVWVWGEFEVDEEIALP
ncbi:MAG: hypothetical protein KDA28_02365 [Phycisphaerales bacterium]|nr:hypothetical protein [Phycisphaerales bacterium]